MKRMLMGILLVSCLASCAAPVQPSTQTARKSAPVRVESAVAQKLVQSVEAYDLDTERGLTVRSGIDQYLRANPGTTFDGWEVYYNRDWDSWTNGGGHSINPDRPLY